MKSTHNKIEIVLPTGKKIVRTIFSGNDGYGAFIKVKGVWFQYDYIDDNVGPKGGYKLTCCGLEDVDERFISAGVDSCYDTRINNALAFVTDERMDHFHKVIRNEFFNGVK